MADPAPSVMFTIGHSTRSLEELLSLLAAHGVTAVADIRTIPRSRRHPQFGQGALAASLADAGIAYRHFPGLGGLRKPKPDSTNTGWRNSGFRGFADYMQTSAFARALQELTEFGTASAGVATAPRVAIMCAEAVWWRCHRQLVADALVTAGWEVRHIVSAGRPELHELTDFARVRGRTVSYPGLL